MILVDRKEITPVDRIGAKGVYVFARDQVEQLKAARDAARVS